MMESTPASLLERVCDSGDSQSLDCLIRLCAPMLFRWARQMGLDNHDADDLIQEVLILLIRKLPEFRYDPSKSFRAWLRTVLKNKWAELRRKQARLVTGESPIEPVEPDSLIPFWESEYHQYLVNHALQFIQKQFEATTWKAFWEVVYHNRPADEVASDLGMTRNAVYLARSRVLARLHRELSGFLE